MMWSGISLIIDAMIGASFFLGEIDVVSSYPDVFPSFSPAPIANQNGADGIQIWNGTYFNFTFLDPSNQCTLAVGNNNVEWSVVEFDNGTSRHTVYIYSGRATPEVIDDTKLTIECTCGNRKEQVNLVILPVMDGVPQDPNHGPMGFKSPNSGVISLPVVLFALLMFCIGMMFVVIVVLGAFAWYYKGKLTATKNVNNGYHLTPSDET